MNARSATILAALVSAAGLANGDIFHRIAVLRGSQEVPANNSTALGSGRFIIDTNANTVTYRIAYTGFTETASHFHGAADPGVSAGVVFALPAGNVKTGTWNYPEALENDLLNGRLYVNVHSATFPGGEIRGQIVSGYAQLEGAQEVPANGSTATGFGLVNINPATNTLSYYVSYGGLSASETAAHIHGLAMPGTASGVLVAIPASNPKVGSWVYSEAQEQAILDGQTYFNVHTTAFPGGEIRGQIITNVNPMDGGQEVPPAPTTAAGVAMVALNRTTNQLALDMRFAGLSSAQTAAHIHGFSPAGSSSGVQFGLSTGPLVRATWSFPASSLNNILNNLTYTNAHTTTFPGGEIRGQLVTPVFGCAPSITAQPSPVTVTEPDRAIFSVVAGGPTTGGTVSFRWRRNGTPIFDGGPYSGAGTAELVIDPTDPSLAGQFDVVVTNTCDSVTSTGVALVVNGGGPACDPDMNLDGNVDQGDVDYLIDVVAGGLNSTGIDPDFNRDGNVDQGDIDALIDVIAGGNCP